MTAQARFDLKLDKNDKELFSEAASLLTLSQRDFKAFSAALDQAFVPNEPLQEALDSVRKTVTRA